VDEVLEPQEINEEIRYLVMRRGNFQCHNCWGSSGDNFLLIQLFWRVKSNTIPQINKNPIVNSFIKGSQHLLSIFLNYYILPHINRLSRHKCVGSHVRNSGSFFSGMVALSDRYMHTDKRENIGHLLEDYLKSSLSTYKEAYQLLFKNPYVKDFLSKHFTCNFL